MLIKYLYRLEKELSEECVYIKCKRGEKVCGNQCYSPTEKVTYV